jgi:hypothetical protein
MDGFASIGRAFATPQYYLTVVVSLILIGFGIYLLVKKTPPKQYGLGAGMMGFGALLIFIAHRSRNLIRTNSRYARIAGLGDVFNFFR